MAEDEDCKRCFFETDPDEKTIRVDRDYSLGMTPRFDPVRPPVFAGILKRSEFYDFVTAVNNDFEEAERFGYAFLRVLGVLRRPHLRRCRSCCETILECLTCYVWPLFFSMQYRSKMRQMEHRLRCFNERYMERGIQVKNPLTNGCLFLEFVVHKTALERVQ